MNKISMGSRKEYHRLSGTSESDEMTSPLNEHHDFNYNQGDQSDSGSPERNSSDDGDNNGPNQSDPKSRNYYSDDAECTTPRESSDTDYPPDTAETAAQVQKSLCYNTEETDYPQYDNKRERSQSEDTDELSSIEHEQRRQRLLSYNSNEADYSDAPLAGRERVSSSEDTDDQHYVVSKRKRQWGTSSLATGSTESAPYANSTSMVHRNARFLSNSTSTDFADTDQEDGEPTTKRPAAMRMMQKMGYREGTGLGKYGQGIVEPIKESNQRGRRGLGLQLPSLSTAGLKYDPSYEVINVEETIQWLDGPEDAPPTNNEMRDWIVVGPRKNSIDDENQFCTPVVLQNVISSKSVFDALDGKELMRARSRANPFEHIRGAFFLNRAAMKMANIDAVFNFMFTNPRDQEDNPILGPHDLLYFADVCAGPGGFTEYVLYKKKWFAKGIGFTLKGANDFRLEDFFAASSETFEPYYGVNDDGNVYTPENIDSLHARVMQITEGIGVHFMMADGGFSVEGQENIQEVLSKRLYLCQCLVALRIVRVGGHFVVKLFDLFTSFSVGLVYLMYRCFHRITIHKPNTSRPANSERYLICDSKRRDCDGVIKHMTRINKKLAQLEDTKQDVMDIVPLHILTEPDSEFFTYIYDSNNRMGETQVVQLLKIAAFCEDSKMQESRQFELRRECLKLYQIPDRPRSAPQLVAPGALATELLGRSVDKLSMNVLIPGESPKSLESQLKCQDVLRGVNDWLCCVVASTKDDDVTQPTFFVAQGGSNIFRYEGREQWKRLPSNVDVELPRKTLLVGELVQEFEGGFGNQKHVTVLHIIDAAYLGGEDIRQKHVEERVALCKTFAKAIRGCHVRAKEFFPLSNLGSQLQLLERRENKNGRPCLGITVKSHQNDVESDWFIKPGGLICLPCTKAPWTRTISKSTGKEYWFNINKRTSIYEFPAEAASDLTYTLDNLRMWWWDDGVRMRDDQQFRPNVKKLQPQHFLYYIHLMNNSMKISWAYPKEIFDNVI